MNNLGLVLRPGKSMVDVAAKIFEELASEPLPRGMEIGRIDYKVLSPASKGRGLRAEFWTPNQRFRGIVQLSFDGVTYSAEISMGGKVRKVEGAIFS